MPRRLLLALLILLAPLTARADPLGDADRGSIAQIISNQIAAFRADDGSTAYSYASPTIQSIFPSPDTFMAMVKGGYPQVYRPQRYAFGRIDTDPSGLPTQHVIIVGPDGKTWEAVYTMQKQPDGTWKINGCTIAVLPGLDA